MPKKKTTRKKSTTKINEKEASKSNIESDLSVDEKKSDPKTKKVKNGKQSKKSTKKTNNEVSGEEVSEKVEKKIEAINPQNDIVEVFDHQKDKEWGFGFEFSKNSDFEKNWAIISKKFEQIPEFDHKFSINWFSQDTEGFIPGEAMKQYLIIWAWGFSIENVKNYFDKLFPKISNVKRVYKISEDLSSDYWIDMPKKNQIIVNGSEIILLPKNTPRRITPIPDDRIKSVPDNIPRYWSTKKLNRARDWLIPVITKKNYEDKLLKVEEYLEEYIIEQIDFEILKDVKTKNMIGVILPEEFNPNNDSENISIPERFNSFNPGFDFGNLPGNFADMNFGN